MEKENNLFALKFQIECFCVSSIFRVWFRSKFDFRNLSTLPTSFSGPNEYFSQNLQSLLKFKRAAEKILDDPGHIIFEISIVLVQV